MHEGSVDFDCAIEADGSTSNCQWVAVDGVTNLRRLLGAMCRRHGIGLLRAAVWRSSKRTKRFTLSFVWTSWMARRRRFTVHPTAVSQMADERRIVGPNTPIGDRQHRSGGPPADRFLPPNPSVMVFNEPKVARPTTRDTGNRVSSTRRSSEPLRENPPAVEVSPSPRPHRPVQAAPRPTAIRRVHHRR